MVCRDRGESTALVSPSPHLRFFLPFLFPFLFSPAFLPAYTQLPSSHILLFFILKNKLFCIFNKPSLPPPPSDIWFYPLPSPPPSCSAQVLVSSELSWCTTAALKAGALWQVNKESLNPPSHSLHLSTSSLPPLWTLSSWLRVDASHQGWFCR